MVKPMGQHPIPVTYSKKPKKDPKGGLASDISPSLCALSSTGCRSPKNGQLWPSVPQNLVNGQQAPNTHLWLILSHSGLINSTSNLSSLAWATWTSCNVIASFSVNSWITASFTGPSTHYSAVMTICLSSDAWLSTSMKSWHAFSWRSWSHW